MAIVTLLTLSCATEEVLSSRNALHRAIWAKDVGEVRRLLRAGADPNATFYDEALLAAAAAAGDVSIAEALINSGAEINRRSGAANESHKTPLAVAAMHGHKPMVAYLIARGANVNRGDTAGAPPLHYAARHSDSAMLALLLQHGARVDAKNTDGMTAIGQAACGSAANVRYLLDRSLDVNVRTRGGFSPLHIAAYCGDAETVQVMIHAGANINARAEDGTTPLYMACTQPGRDSVIEELLNAGADPTLTGHAGLTPMGIADRSKYSRTVELLRSHGIQQ